jgi:hypothetical protein
VSSNLIRIVGSPSDSSSTYEEGKRPLDDTPDGHDEEAAEVASRVTFDTGAPHLWSMSKRTLQTAYKTQPPSD